AKLAQIWAEQLGIETVGVTDNFFALGGHSLKGVMLIKQMQKQFRVDVPLRELFKRPTIREIAQWMQEAGEFRYAAIEPAAEQPYYPVSEAQRHMLSLAMLEQVGTSYNMPSVHVVEGNFDTERFERVIRKLVERHESLRTSFDFVNHEAVQVVHPPDAFAIQRLQATEETIELVIQDFIRPFDLMEAPLFRVGLVEINETRHYLLFDMHHIISDGVSKDILIRELVAAYTGHTLPELRIQYKDFAVWQQEYMASTAFLQQKNYWLTRFAEPVPALRLPTDHKRSEARSFAGGMHTFELDREMTARLHKLTQKTGTTLYMVLLAAYQVLLSKYSGQTDLAVGTPVAGRPHADLAAMMGVFINTLVMRNQPTGDKTFAEFLAEVKESTLEAFDHQDYSFAALVKELGLTPTLDRNPLFDTMFIMQNIERQAFQLDDVELTAYPLSQQTAKMDLSLAVEEKFGTLVFGFEYSTQLFEARSIAQMADSYLTLLRTIVESEDVQIKHLQVVDAAGAADLEELEDLMDEDIEFSF
ncbi:MAG: condensation domain-containing protein, partial [Tumebacillaceae bacterium]